jgi:hypothetical protein
MMKTILIAMLAVLSASLAAEAAGPFGFEKGMTRSQVTALIGASHVDASDSSHPDMLTTDTAPSPYPAFEAYILIFSPTEGLLKVAAVGKDIEDDAFGTVTTMKFHELVEALAHTYGPATKVYDFLRSGSIWTEPRDWMSGVHHNDRTLRAFWDTNTSSHVMSITLDTAAVDRSTGHLRLSYEFAGFEAYVDQRKAKEADRL